jgi:integrase
MYYFGPWEDPDAALACYLAQRDDLHAGRKPRAVPEALTVKELANAFLNRKQALVDTGELTRRSWDDYKRTCDLVVSHFGKGRVVSDLRQEDFASLRDKMARRWGPVTLAHAIERIRVIFRFASDDGLLERPVQYGRSFQAPTRKVLRLHRARQGRKLFDAVEIRLLLAAAGTQLQAMTLLGINCAYGNSDCGNLPLAALDLKQGIIDFPRPKTGVNRRCVLWPETVAALRAALTERPESKDAADAGLVFLTHCGARWHKDRRENPVTKEFGKLLRRLHINGRKGLGFYTLRHTFRTIADEARDQPAADYIMGHESPHMSTVYRERISDDRLRGVAAYVRAWLFPPAKPEKKAEEASQGVADAGAVQ